MKDDILNKLVTFDGYKNKVQMQVRKYGTN